jgi:hypothetical protein
VLMGPGRYPPAEAEVPEAEVAPTDVPSSRAMSGGVRYYDGPDALSNAARDTLAGVLADDGPRMVCKCDGFVCDCDWA